MKRGLKVVYRRNLLIRYFRSNLCPDEKGTESAQPLSVQRRILSSNLCPDEKGTESL